MASGFFALFDDVAVLLDDAAVMSKVAAKKTAGLLGDDLAVNAEKATGFHASRELPVIWAITKGSILNKLIILPLAFVLSSFAPWLIVPILLLGGAYLAFEGAEKLLELIGVTKPHAVKASPEKVPEDKKQHEKEKIRSAIRTDFILSIEIVIITLESVMAQSLALQILVVSFIALVATVGVYGFVAILVRLDDAGLYLLTHVREAAGERIFLKDKILNFTGNLLISMLPKIIRLLTIVGTIAMLLVGGGMYVHNIPPVHELTHFMPALVADFSVGLVLGLLIIPVVLLGKKIRR